MEIPSLLGILDIGLVAASVFVAITWLRRARAGRAILGALTIALVYLAAREFRLQLTAWIFQGFLAVFVLVLVVVLQNDFRRLFEQAANWNWRHRRATRDAAATEALCESVFEMAERRCGALLVLPGRDPIERHIDGGERLDGLLSKSLLLSLFDPGSVGHDGAVVLEGNRVTWFAVHLPLSTNFGEIQTLGTRHSAALGLSETTDAFVVAVSEERGEVTIARYGKFRVVDAPGVLLAELGEFAREFKTGSDRSGRFRRVLQRRWADAVVALLLSIGMWQLFIAGSKAGQKVLTIPVLVDNIAPGFEVEAIDPPDVEIELGGLQRDLYLIDPTDLEIRVDAASVSEGQRTFELTEGNVHRDPALTVRTLNPKTVKLTVRAAEIEVPESVPASPPN